MLPGEIPRTAGAAQAEEGEDSRLNSLTEGTSANEAAALQGFVLDLCQALGVAAPSLPTDDYRFEKPVEVVESDGNVAQNRIDAIGLAVSPWRGRRRGWQSPTRT